MTMPVDQKLYDTVKAKVYKEIPKHSAYRSGIVVQKYKKAFTKKYGKRKQPYKGNKKQTQKRGLTRWFREKWVNQRGKIGYKYKSDIYRPSIRISKETPTTHGELSNKQIKRARKKKATLGRVNRFKVKTGGNKTKKLKPQPKMKNGAYFFEDHPEFRPNLSPREMFLLGSFGGTYWRPIHSSVTKKNYKNQHKKYPSSWWANIPEHFLTTPWDKYDTSLNKYKVKVGNTLEFWEEKGWIEPEQPYGWVQWYCDFFIGKRGSDDERQIRRWNNLTGPKGRFRNNLIGQIIRKNTTYNDFSVSPKIRQVLQHWGYKLTKKDFDKAVTTRKK